MTEIGMDRLCSAIIIQAAKDYKDSLCGIGENPERMSSDCERFFKGNIISMYTKLNGVYLMDKIYEEACSCNFNINSVHKIRSNDPYIEQD